MYRLSAGANLVIVLFTSLALLIMAPATPAFARSHSHQTHHIKHHSTKHHYRRVAYNPPQSALVIDGTSGKVLYAHNANAKRYPASLTKMMTLYLLFDRLERGKISLDTMITASPHAVAQKPTKLGLYNGESISVELAIKAIVVRSANDVAVAVAEALGGSESEFAYMMTREAHVLGMNSTEFHNASGLPNPEQTTTARDMALLGRHLAYDFPQYYHYFATPYFTYQGRVYETHDNLLDRFDGADGIKTGYTNASGFNLVTSVVREDKHLIGVVMGGHTARSRDNQMIDLLAGALVHARQDPMLVAKADVPWQNPNAKVGTKFAIVDSDVATPQMKPLDLTVQASDDDAAPPETDDEDVAEKTTGGGKHAKDAQIASAAPTPQLRYTPLSNGMTVPTPKPQVVASLQPEAQDDAPPPDTEEGDVAGVSVPVQTSQHPLEAAGMKLWAIQIGAFNDFATAKTQLALYAERSMDILGRAKRSIVAFLSTDGQKLYRARFASFTENEAREVCKRMSERGQNCFATTVSD